MRRQERAGQRRSQHQQHERARHQIGPTLRHGPPRPQVPCPLAICADESVTGLALGRLASARSDLDTVRVGNAPPCVVHTRTQRHTWLRVPARSAPGPRRARHSDARGSVGGRGHTRMYTYSSFAAAEMERHKYSELQRKTCDRVCPMTTFRLPQLQKAVAFLCSRYELHERSIDSPLL